MKTLLFTIIFLLLCSQSYSQIIISRNNGGAMDYISFNKIKKLNDNSTLLREWIVLNDTACPVKLNNDVGVNTFFDGNVSSFRFRAVGSIETSEEITAYEIYHVLYNVFGEYISTLSNVNIADINGLAKVEGGSTWYGTSVDIVSYLSCVSFVASVRNKAGVIWKYKPSLIKEELNKIQIAYEERYTPSNEK